jgi:predicted nucleic acid-binding protein
MYIFDYGAPTGLRLALTHGDRISAIISQNGNAYEEGLGDAWGPVRKYWSEPTSENREVLRREILTLAGTKWQYTHGVKDPASVPPETYTLDFALMQRPGNEEIQLDLYLDYASNVRLYSKFQEYFRAAELLSYPKLSAEGRLLFQDVPLLEIEAGYWQRAGLLRAKILAKGRRARLGDALIAQSCIDRGLQLIARDRDFQAFAESAGLKLA